MNGHIMEIGTIFVWRTYIGELISTCMIIRQPSPESKWNMHTIYRFDHRDFHPYMPDGKEEILA